MTGVLRTMSGLSYKSVYLLEMPSLTKSVVARVSRCQIVRLKGKRGVAGSRKPHDDLTGDFGRQLDHP